MLGLYFTLRRFAPRIPAGLVTVVTAGIASVALHLEDHSVAVVGDVTSGLAAPGLPVVGFEQLSQLAIPAAGLALVRFADAAAITHVYAKKHGYTIDDNRELVGLGTANVVSPDSPTPSRSVPAARALPRMTPPAAPPPSYRSWSSSVR